MMIGEAAQQSGLEASAIRFYEKSGVVPSSRRTMSEYRDYDAGDVELLRFVRRLRGLGLPLDDIREIVELRTAGEAPCRPVREAIAREAASIDTRIAELDRLRSELKHLNDVAAHVVDDWPQTCICHVLEESPERQTV